MGSKRGSFEAERWTRYDQETLPPKTRATLDRDPLHSRAGRTDETPLSSSGVVPKGDAAAPRSRHHSARARDSEPPSSDRHLTPYQARLDVEMDDTAVSKVRDPSASIRLDAVGVRPAPARRGERPADPERRDAIASIVLGVVLGALFVVAVALIVRAFAS